MTFVSGVLAFVGVAALLSGLVLLFLPRRMSRRNSALLMCGGFVAMIVSGVILPEEVRLERERAEAQRREERQRQQAAEDAERRKKEQEASAAAVAEAASPEGRARRIRSAVQDALGKSNRQGVGPPQVEYDATTGKVPVTWPISDNLTEKMIKRGAQKDVVKILKAVSSSGVGYNTIDVHGTFSMSDRFGNASEQPVLFLTYQKATVDRINFENFLTENVYAIADGQRIHPAFRP